MLFGMALIWGVNFSVVKYGTAYLHPLAYNSVRVGLAAVCLLGIAVAMRQPWPSRPEVRRLLLLGVLGNCVYQVLFIFGIAQTRAGTAALILASSPAFIALMSRWGGTERTTSRGWFAIAFQIAGMACVVYGTAALPNGRGTLVGPFLVLGGSLAWAAFSVALKPHVNRVSGIQLAALTMTGGAVPLLLLATPAIAATSWPAVPLGAWLSVLYSGIGALVIAYLLWYRGVQLIGATRTAMYGNMQPLIALLVAWVTLSEAPTVWQGIGAAGIMSGLLLHRP